MQSATLQVARSSVKFVSDDKRVIPRYLNFGDGRRIRSILGRVMKLDDEQVAQQLSEAIEDFAHRHREIRIAFMDNYSQVIRHYRGSPAGLSDERKLLIGAYFTLEYSIESAALFNPSIVPHPNQQEVPEGAARFLMSMRATGEGHISSIVFRRGVIGGSGQIDFDPPPRYAYSSRPIPDKQYDKKAFFRKLMEMELLTDLVRPVLDALPDPFSLEQLERTIKQVRPEAPHRRAYRSAARNMLWLARANYELRFPDDCRPAEIVIFPATDVESRGMEDLRLVQFTGDDGRKTYYGTYTAFDGAHILPMLLETEDFHRFHISTLSGRFARNKGMALFPRTVGGRFAMISRHDGESLFLLRSDDIYRWDEVVDLQVPAEPWELVQIGNSGSPLETDAGWLLLTHGVGPVRRYAIGAMLLDRDDPGRVLGRLRQPLIIPIDDEREGYVPNVVYSCGSMIHGDQLVIPYAMADVATTFATVSVHELIDRLLEAGP